MINTPDWCKEDSSIDVHSESSALSEPTIENLIYSVHSSALVAQKLDLISTAISRFLATLPSGSWEESDIGIITNGLDYKIYEIIRLKRAQNYHLRKVEEYKKQLARMLKKYLKNKSPTGGVAPTIFLQLCPSDVPPQYLKMAKEVHLDRIGESASDVTSEIDEAKSQSALCQAFHSSSSSSHGRLGCGCIVRSFTDRLWPR
ncbi:hypothetical protein SeLEV6574_g08330 [Synchytrium endobioticum]|nr:hypothetical protein SeLEV6574_g08330 [Synchytrium endobioticum]